MLREEGIEYNPETDQYIDPDGIIIDLDIQKVISDYLEHM